MNDAYCGDCINLHPTENEQDELKTNHPHMCSALKMVIKHNGFHPDLPRPEKCFKVDGKQLKSNHTLQGEG